MIKCEHRDDPTSECGGKVELRHSRTRYVFDGKRNSPEDPNRDFYACANHWDSYDDYWTEMWNDYYASTLSFKEPCGDYYESSLSFADLSSDYYKWRRE